MIWFYTEWCPYCKSKKKIWDEFVKSVNLADYSIPIYFKEIDCDKNSTSADKYNIDEYPSVRLIYKNKTYIYDAKIDSDILTEFLKGIIPNNNS